MATQKHMKVGLLALLIAVVMSTLTGSFDRALAAVEQANFRRCEIVVLPFNPGQTIPGEADVDRFVTHITGGDCTSHLNINAQTQYSPQPPRIEDNALAANTDNKTIPVTLHTHAFHDLSLEDDYYYDSFVDRFVITIKADAVANTNIDNLVCYAPIPSGLTREVRDALFADIEANIADCNGEIRNPIMWGGTTVRKEVVNRNEYKVTWRFAQFNNNGGRPHLYGNNGANFPVYDGEGNVTQRLNDLDNQNGMFRNLGFRVALTSRNNDAQIWSATTTSRALVAHEAINKDNFGRNFGGCFNNDDRNLNHEQSGWCYLPPAAGTPAADIVNNIPTRAGNKTFFWETIGSVTTIWRKPTPPVQPPSITIEKTISGALVCHDHVANLPTLQNGATGAHVRHLQTDLNAVMGREQPVDGTFGPLTQGTVLRYQLDNHLETDGIVGPSTWQALEYSMNENCDRAEQIRQFTFDITGPNNFRRDNVHAGERIELPRAGRYTLSEDARDGYTPGPWGRDCSANGSIDLVNGQNARCTINNTSAPIIPPEITIQKTVVGSNADINSFTYYVEGPDGPNSHRRRMRAGEATQLLDGPGTYHLSETAAPGFETSTWGRPCAPDGTIRLAEGQHASCAITNRFSPPELHVYKVIEPNADGDRGPNAVTDFAIVVTGPGNYRTTNRNGDVLDLPAGTYHVTEENIPAGYEFVRYQGSCARENIAGDVTLRPGDVKDCFIVNRYRRQPPPPEGNFKVRKVVITVDGRRVASREFTLYYQPVGGPRQEVRFIDRFFGVDPNTYTVTEDQRDGYEFVGFEDDCVANFPGHPEKASVTVRANERKTCTVVNRELPPRVKVIKTTIGTLTPPSDQIYDFVLHRRDTVQDIGPNGQGISFKAREEVGDDENLVPGNYRIVETPLAGYRQGRWGGDCDVNGNVTLTPGHLAVCSMSNEVTPPGGNPPHIVLNKIITLNEWNAQPSQFNLYYDGGNGQIRPALGESRQVAAGTTYTIGETLLPNYRFVGVQSGSDCTVNANGTASLTIPAQGYKPVYSCTLINESFNTPPPPPPSAQIHVIKAFVNGIAGPAPITDFRFTAAGPGVNQTMMLHDQYLPVNPGTYSIRETNIPNGYTFDHYEGDCNPLTTGLIPGDMTVHANETKTCVVVNRFGAIPPTPENMSGTLTKIATNANASRGSTVAPGDIVNYDVTFQAAKNSAIIPSVTINDIMPEDNDGDPLTFTTSFKSKYRRDPSTLLVRHRLVGENLWRPVLRCVRGATNNCYTGDPFSAAGITIFTVSSEESVGIVYRAKLESSGVNPDSCQAAALQGVCGDRFENTAIARILAAPVVPGNLPREILDIILKIGPSGLLLPNGMLVARATTAVFTPCPFILTQGLGDIILQQDFAIGTDILKCGGIPNIEGPIIKEITPPPPVRIVPKSGAGDLPTHEACRTSGGVIGTLSSGICEIKSSLNDDLTRDEIESAIMENLIRFTRVSDETDQRYNRQGPITLTEDRAETNGIFKYITGDVHLNSFNEKLEGARTYIIEDGDLYIDSNVEFAEAEINGSSFRNVPAAAFIVINGSIKVDPTVTRLDGIYVAIRGPGSSDIHDGELNCSRSNGAAVPLAFDGAVYGNIEPLFRCRAAAAGNAQQGIAPISINFGAWIYYNMPPILKDLVEVQQEQVAR
ncbi:peptidoglycan-binding protein [Candidatus Gracilibacteria bacterium]|nr:peptidoglycan-binding protein [Candidatus Gracilibacteria bacterium]